MRSEPQRRQLYPAKIARKSAPVTTGIVLSFPDGRSFIAHFAQKIIEGHQKFYKEVIPKPGEAEFKSLSMRLACWRTFCEKTMMRADSQFPKLTFGEKMNYTQR